MSLIQTLATSHWRDLLFSLARREVVARYKRSFLGLGWALAEPLSLALVYFIVFQGFAKVEVENYPFYLLAGLLPWTFLQSTVGHCAGVVLEYGAIIKKVAFPRELLVLGKLLSQSVNLIISMALLLGASLLAGMPPGWHWLWLLPAFALLTLLASALGSAAAAITPYANDVPYLLQFGFRLGTYAAPIIYKPSMVPDQWKWLVEWNPSAGVIELFHMGILGPSYVWSETLIRNSAISTIVLAWLGWSVFARIKPHLAEVV